VRRRAAVVSISANRVASNMPALLTETVRCAAISCDRDLAADENRISSPHDGRLISIEYMVGKDERFLSTHHAIRKREEYLHPALRF